MSKTKGPPNMLVPAETEEECQDLDDAQFGRLIRGMLGFFFRDEDVHLDPPEKFLFGCFKTRLRKQKEAYAETVEMKKKAANIRWHGAEDMQTDADACECIESNQSEIKENNVNPDHQPINRIEELVEKLTGDGFSEREINEAIERMDAERKQGTEIKSEYAYAKRIILNLRKDVKPAAGHGKRQEPYHQRDCSGEQDEAMKLFLRQNGVEV